MVLRSAQFAMLEDTDLAIQRFAKVGTQAFEINNLVKHNVLVTRPDHPCVGHPFHTEIA